MLTKVVSRMHLYAKQMQSVKILKKEVEGRELKEVFDAFAEVITKQMNLKQKQEAVRMKSKHN